MLHSRVRRLAILLAFRRVPCKQAIVYNMVQRTTSTYLLPLLLENRRADEHATKAHCTSSYARSQEKMFISSESWVCIESFNY